MHVTVLVLSGDAGLPISPATVRAPGRVMLRAQVRVLPGQTHAVGPAVLAQVLGDFDTA